MTASKPKSRWTFCKEAVDECSEAAGTAGHRGAHGCSDALRREVFLTLDALRTSYLVLARTETKGTT